MINRDRPFQTFIQSCNSCTLTSYAVAAYGFLNIPPKPFFEAYCAHFKVEISKYIDAEHCYDAHFQNEWRSRNCQGYKIIQELHNTSNEEVFKKCRKCFDVEFISEVISDEERIKDILKQRESLISIAFSVLRGIHSAAVGLDEIGWYMVETRPDLLKSGILPISGLNDLGGRSYDGLLMIKR